MQHEPFHIRASINGSRQGCNSKGRTMIVYGVPLDRLEYFSERTGVVLYNVRDYGTGHAFVLRPVSGSDTFRATSEYYGKSRRKWAVCYHGHYAFMRMMFECFPNARLRSAMAKFNGIDDFNAYAGLVGIQNVGSQMQPRRFEDSCKCIDIMKETA